VYLRDNDLESDALRLGHLHGTFDQAEETLVSPLVTATLGGHPVELRDVRTFPLAALARVPDADPWLAREGFWEDKNGRALQADLFVRDLPLDAEHLAGLLSPAALEDLRRTEHWRGALDVLGARLVLTREGENAGKVAMRGRLRAARPRAAPRPAHHGADREREPRGARARVEPLPRLGAHRRALRAHRRARSLGRGA
jgi:hypothetical protein